MVSLVVPAQLEGFPGSPFSDQLVESACEAIRSIAKWHIAPSVTETISIDGPGGQYLALPTLRLTGVAAVRDVSGDTPRVLDGYRFDKAGLVFRQAGWPCGFKVLEVDMVHGYAECPAELLPLIAAQTRDAARDTNVSAEAAGPFNRSYDLSIDDVTGAARIPAELARYRLPVFA
ncbi:hypothetical protein [Luteipulveratus mongoliensis]|uniref:Head-to-tail adaptor n=1 Tax=Luteipulveratus mongoliensis TaxID=571913 RepID=A0A0K1JGC9_9MICO|nr:hypothetical protein [Luteipulveratus mongoliensis]AKU15751.1 hypothetical protein VV02_07620 [Luteipulveratus mongoliensis]